MELPFFSENPWDDVLDLPPATSWNQSRVASSDTSADGSKRNLDTDWEMHVPEESISPSNSQVSNDAYQFIFDDNEDLKQPNGYPCNSAAPETVPSSASRQITDKPYCNLQNPNEHMTTNSVVNQTTQLEGSTPALQQMNQQPKESTDHASKSESAKVANPGKEKVRRQRPRRKNIAASSRLSREKRKREVQELKRRNQVLCKEREEYIGRIAELQSQVQYVREEGRIDLEMENRLLRAEVLEHKKFVNEFKRFMQQIPVDSLDQHDATRMANWDDEEHQNGTSDAGFSDGAYATSEQSTPGTSQLPTSPSFTYKDMQCATSSDHVSRSSKLRQEREQHLMRRAAVCGIEQAVSLSMSSSVSPNFSPLKTQFNMRVYYQNFPLGASAKLAKRIMLRVEMVYKRSLETCEKAMMALGSGSKALELLYSHMGEAKLVDLETKCSLELGHGLPYATTCKALLQRLQIGGKIGEYVYVNSTQRRPISQACLYRNQQSRSAHSRDEKDVEARNDCLRPGFVMTATADKESWETFKDEDSEIPHGFASGLEGWVLYPLSEKETAVVLVCNYTKQEWLVGSEHAKNSEEYEFVSDEGIASDALNNLLGLVDPNSIEVLEQLAALKVM